MKSITKSIGLSTMFVCLILSPYTLAQEVSELLVEDDVPELARKASASTVILRLTSQKGQVSIGTGFFIPSTYTYIVTNYHVLIGATKGTAKIVNKAKTYPIEGIVATDLANDLAILQVAIPGIKPLPLGDSDKMEVGMRVYAVGNPIGLEGTFSEGRISGIRTIDNKKRLQFTADISHGSSGGPVLNRDQEVIGIAYMSYEGGQNLNFAIPSNYIKELLKAKGLVTPLPQEQENITAEDYFMRGLNNFSKGLVTVTDSDFTLVDSDLTSAVSDSNLASAVSDFTEVIRLKPDRVAAYIMRGEAKFKLHQYAEAIMDFNQAIRRDSTNDVVPYYDVYFYLGQSKIGLKQYKAAIADLDVFIGEKHTSYLVTFAYNLRGIAKFSLSDYDAAITDFDRSIIGIPDFADAYYNRGEAKRHSEQHSEFDARVDYKMAILLEPDFHAAYFGRAKSYYAQGFLDSAEKDVKAALKIVKEAGLASESIFESLLDYESFFEEIMKKQQSE